MHVKRNLPADSPPLPRSRRPSRALLGQDLLAQVAHLALIDDQHTTLEVGDQPGHGLSRRADRAGDVLVGRPAHRDPAVAEDLAVLPGEVDEVAGEPTNDIEHDQRFHLRVGAAQTHR